MKKKVALVCGGISGEHEISLISCKHILKALDRRQYEAHVVLIQKDRRMELISPDLLEAVPDNPKLHKEIRGKALDFRPYPSKGENAGFVLNSELLEVDIVFPVLHGEGGEDGSIQGFFQTAGLPVVGCSLTSSALGMDKALAKKICQMDGLPVVEFTELQSESEMDALSLTYPCFVKPAVGGSSLGVSRVESQAELRLAIKEAFKFDKKVMIERAIRGRELEIAILWDKKSCVVSPAGEIICEKTKFYSYEAKYVDGGAARLEAPARLTAQELAELQQTALKIFQSLGCWGMARIDFFQDQDGKFLFNEINTIPGFTPISMYPRLMSLAGVSYSELLSRLIEAAR